jgi:L-arabinokinase
MNIAYYITGHGFGHAVRSVEIINALLRTDRNLNLYIRTSAPAWIFKHLDASRVRLDPIDLDVGAIQKNSFSVDKRATLQQYANRIAQKSRCVDRECSFLTDQSIDIVVSDITPMAFDAAHRLGLPSFGVANFSWDWIYNDWIEDHPSMRFVVDDIRQSYQKCSLLFRLPFYGSLSAFNPVIDVPLVARRSQVPRTALRHQLGYRESDILILMALRQQDLEPVQWDKLDVNDDMTVLSSKIIPHPRFSLIDERAVHFPDLLNACDAVVSKPGYGIVSECIANQTKLLYVPRKDFAEEPILQNALDQWATSNCLKPTDFKAGSWHTHLNALLQKPDHWPEIALDGADLIARILIKT